MAREIRVILTDDIDGGEGARTVEFSLDKTAYSIDLSEANIAKLEAALAPYIAKAERVRPRRTAASAGGRKAAGSRSGGGSSAIREWARANGYEVSDRGRVPGAVVAAYEAAN